jgi:peptidoglycan hydrolase-like protein with peptidoglycan-binding domain
MASQTVIERLRAGGIVAPKLCVAEAARAGLRLELAAALLDKESGGGHNVFGHDRDRNGKYIFPARDGTVKVTKELYREYKRRRIASGNKAMQGVGPCQLTWYSFQDDADELGGCWKPQINMRVGFRRLASLIRTHGDAVGARMYNGSGDAAVAYSADLLRKAAAWKARLDGATPVPVDGAPLRRGDRGPRVVRLTRRLARTRSKAGTPYLAKPRREFGATVEAALKAFQAEHKLEPDGVYGPLSQRKLNRVLRLQQKPPEPAEDVPVKRSRTRLKPLVAEVLRRDAQTGEAWEALVAHAAKRRRLLAGLRAKKKTAAGGAALNATVAEAFAAVTAAL